MSNTEKVLNLTAKRVTHAFGDNVVLRDVSLSVFPGQITALVGENGAGKSTFMRLASGYLPVSDGKLEWHGNRIPHNITDAEKAGITLVHQEFALIADLTVAENVLLGHEPARAGLIDRQKMAQRSRDALKLLGVELDPNTMLRDLPVAQWQMVELAKAFSKKPKLLLMDEPTAVLGKQEVEALFTRMRAFADAGGSIIFTSHRLDEVRAIADRVAVLRDGEITLNDETAALSEHDIASAMVGREIEDLFPPRKATAPKASLPLIEVEGLHVARELGEDVIDASFELYAGEILGVAGLVGSGRTEMFEGLVGLRKARASSFKLRGLERSLPRAVEAWQQGIAYLTEDRKARGLWLDASLIVNTSLTHGAVNGPRWINRIAERKRYEVAKEQYGIKAASADINVGRLSGGNQQKVLLAKTLASDPDVIILDEPTRGVDIGAKTLIYEVISELASIGKAVVVISSELPELIGLSQRVLVMDRGRIAGVIKQPANGNLTENEILHLALGLEHKRASELETI